MKTPIRSISIKNVMGIKDMQINAEGDLVQIAGRNGTGKTSIDAALRAALRGEMSMTMIHQDAETGEVLVTLRDGTAIKRKIGKRPQLKITDPDGHVIPSPAKWLSEHFDVASIDPVELLDASPTKRIEMIAEAVNVELDLMDLRNALTGVDIDEKKLGILVDSQPAFDAIKALEQKVVRLRQDEGRRKKDHEAAAKELRKSLPDTEIDGPENLSQEIDKQRDFIKRVMEHQTKRTIEEVEKVQDALAVEKKALLHSKETFEKSIKEDQAKLDEINDSLRHFANQEKDDIEKVKIEIANKASEAVTKAEDTIEKLTERHGIAKERINTLGIVKTHESKAEQAEKSWNHLQGARDNLRSLKKSLIDDLGIPGLEVLDDVVYNGVHWERINTAQRIMIAVKVAIFRGGNVIVLDRTESLDATTLKALVDMCQEEEVQLWTLGVSNEELSVT